MARSILAAIALALTVSVAPAAENRWLHVAVDGEDESVRINLPFAVAHAAIPLVEVHAGRSPLRDGDVDRAKLRELLSTLRAAQDGEYVTVRDGEEDVRVAKDGKFLVVHARGKGKDAKKRVEVRMPLEVVAALLSGEGDELDLAAGLDALAKHGEGDLVAVTEEGKTVRIWIDRKPSS